MSERPVLEPTAEHPITVEIGTSSEAQAQQVLINRLARVDGIRVIEEILQCSFAVAAQGFAEVLEAQLGDWVDDTPIVMSGMIGSRQGWLVRSTSSALLVLATTENDVPACF